MLGKLKGTDQCTSAKRMTSILRHVDVVFPPARQGTILNSHRVIGIATNFFNGAEVRLSDLHNDDNRCRSGPDAV